MKYGIILPQIESTKKLHTTQHILMVVAKETQAMLHLHFEKYLPK